MKWIKPNGTKIETNDEPATLEYGRKHGWKEQFEDTEMEEDTDKHPESPEPDEPDEDAPEPRKIVPGKQSRKK